MSPQEMPETRRCYDGSQRCESLGTSPISQPMVASGRAACNPNSEGAGAPAPAQCGRPACGLAEGERQKLHAQALLESRREALIRNARRALLGLLLTNRTAAVDDIRHCVEVPAGVNPKAFGSVPGMLARKGLIRRVGFRNTHRPEGHARPIAVWQLIDPEGARRWLADHPPADAGLSDGMAQPIEAAPEQRRLF